MCDIKSDCLHCLIVVSIVYSVVLFNFNYFYTSDFQFIVSASEIK